MYSTDLADPQTPRYPPHVPASLCWVVGIFLTVFWTAMEAATVLWQGDCHEAMSRIARRWATSIARFCKVEVVVHGREHLPAGRTVLIANHEGIFDVIAMLGYLPGHLRMLAKSSLFRIPVLGWGMRRMGHISVDRRKRSAAVRDMRSARARLDEGISVVVFAEGTRTADGRLQRFKKGGAVLAIETGATLVPVAIEGSREVAPKGSIEIRPGRIDLYILPPIPVEGLAYEGRAQLTDQLRARIAAQLEVVGPAPPARRPLPG